MPDCLSLQDMSLFVEVVSVVMDLRAHGPLLCSEPLFRGWHELIGGEPEGGVNERDVVRGRGCFAREALLLKYKRRSDLFWTSRKIWKWPATETLVENLSCRVCNSILTQGRPADEKISGGVFHWHKMGCITQFVVYRGLLGTKWLTATAWRKMIEVKCCHMSRTALLWWRELSGSFQNRLILYCTVCGKHFSSKCIPTTRQV